MTVWEKLSHFASFENIFNNNSQNIFFMLHRRWKIIQVWNGTRVGHLREGKWRPDKLFMYFNFLLCCMISLCSIFHYPMLCVYIESVKKFQRVSLRLRRHKQMLGKFLAFCGVKYETCESTEAESQLYLHIMHRPMTPPQDLRRTYWFTSPIQAPEARIYLL